MKKMFKAFSSLEIRDMTIRMKRREKIIAIILLVAMCLSMVPYQALAKIDYESSEVEQPEEVSDEHIYNVDVDPKDIPIVSEDISKRTANEKHFRKADGSYEVAIYDSNVHYKDGNEWKDIDNSLVSTTRDGSYHNKANQFDINFPKDISKQDIKLTMDEYQVSWKLVGSKASTLVKDDSKNIKTSESDLRALINISKQVAYSEVIKGVDLIYNLNGTKVKEEIVVDSYQSDLSLNFEYNLKGLSFEQTDENIVLVNEKDEIVFVFDPLLMFDDKGNESSDIEYKIEETGKNTYIFSVIPNDAWLQDAAYPVTIDPTIDSSSGMGIFDTCISECYPSSSYYSATKMTIGDDASNGEFRGLLYFTLPSELEDQMITYASLGFVKYNVTEDAQINIYQNTQRFSSSTVRWESAPTYDSRVIDYYIVDTDTPFMFDITESVKEWQASGLTTVPGFTLALDEGSQSLNSVYQNGAIGDATNPKITIGYESPRGLKDYWTYMSQDLGPAGTGYVSDYTGHLTWMRNDYQLDNEYMSLSLNMVFSRLSSDNAVSNGYGIGWKTGYNQQMLYDDVVDQYYLLKADGEKVFFVELNHEPVYSGVVRYDCVAENGSGMVLTYHTYQGNLYGTSTVEIKDKIRYTFSSTMGRLIKITNTITNHYLDISYLDTTSIKISQVTDTVGNKIKFTYYSGELYRTNLYLKQSNNTFKLIEYKRYTYNTLNCLTSITSYSNYDDNLTTTISNMTTNNLSETVGVKIIPDPIIIKPPFEPPFEPLPPNQGYTSSNKINYTYDSNHLLVSVENDLRGQKITYVYDSNDRVIQTSATDSGENISKININYDNHQTIYSDDFGYTTTYLFDHYGHTINIQDSDGNAQYFKYTGLFTYVGHLDQDFNYSEVINSNPNYYLVHKVLEKSEVLKQTQNQVSNHGFEYTHGWNFYNNTTGRVSYTNDEAVFGSQSLKVFNQGTNPYAQQSFYLEAGYYTVYGYIKNDGDLVNGKGAYISVLNATSATYQEESQICGSDEWKSYKIDIYVSSATSVTLKLCNESISTAYFDNIQLYEGFSESRYNVLTNSGFENGTTAWTRSGAYTTTSNSATGMDDILGRYSMYISGDGEDDERYFYQQVNGILTSAGETFTIGGWGKALAVPQKSYYNEGINDDNRFFGIYIEFECIAPDDECGQAYYEYVYLPFNTNTKDWQYQMTTFEIPVEVVNARVYGRYQGEGIAYFDNIQMYHDDIATAYDYDGSTGYLREVKNSDGTRTTYTYDAEGNLTGIDTEEISTDVSYNNNNMVESVEQNNVRATIEYDVSTKHVVNQYVGYDKDSSTQDKWFKTSTSYIYHSQYIHTQTDEFGNTTTYNYNEHTGLLSEIIDDEGGSVTYTYNDLAQILEKEFSDEVTYSYTYDSKHRLATITVSGLVYSFDYNDIDQLISVSIDGEVIVSYDYVEKENLAGTKSYLTDLLEKKTYGNGDYYYYEYNDEDMLVSGYFNSTTVPMYQYEYDTSGRLGVIYDYANNDVQYYSYDLAGKLERITDVSGNEIYYRYDEQGNLAEYEYRVSDIEREVIYHYNDVTGEYDYTSYISSQGYVEKAYHYDEDSLRRLHDITLTVNHANIMTMTYDYSDISVQQGNATTRIYRITYDFANYNDYTYQYIYDGNQNITQIKKLQGTAIIEQYDYHYDELNQLVREDIWFRWSDDYTYAYTFDDLGNILSKYQYQYASPSNSLPTTWITKRTYEYYYNNKTQLSYIAEYDSNNQQVMELEFEYDNAGNPIDYIDYANGDFVNFYWEGRRLTGIDTDGDHISDIVYKYNSNSIRTYKRDGDDTYEYILDGDLVLVEYINGNPIYYTYDANNQLISMNYNENEYFYVYDLLGNVIGLLDDMGHLVVSYTYDAWGNILTQSSTVNNLDYINPYRYRGYRYDEETGYYYLQARYYDPAIGRFISIDDVSYLSDDLSSSANLYAYAVNNPVMYVDYGGNSVAAIVLALAGISIGEVIIITVIAVLVIATIYEGVMLIKEAAEKSANQKSKKSVPEDSIPDLPYDNINADDLENSNLGEDGWVWKDENVWVHGEKGSIRNHKKDKNHETHGDYTPRGNSKKADKWRIYGNGTIENKWSKQKFPIPKNKTINGE